MLWLYRIVSFIMIPPLIYFPVNFIQSRSELITHTQILTFIFMIFWAISSVYYVIRTWKLKNISSEIKVEPLDIEKKEHLLPKFFLVKFLSVTNIIASAIFGVLTLLSLYKIITLNILLRDAVIFQIIFSMIVVLYSILTINISLKALKTYSLEPIKSKS